MITARQFRIALMTALASVALTACANDLSNAPASTASVDKTRGPARTATSQSRQVNIALLLPLGGFGESARIARGMKQAAEMALVDANDPGVQLNVKDDGGTPEGAKAAAAAAIGEGAEIILGPIFSKAAAGAGQAARPFRIPVLSFSNDPAVAGDGVYLMSFLASDEVDRVIGYAAAHGKRRFAALIPASPYGQTVEPAFRKAIAANGAELVAAETYTPDANGILEAAKRTLAAIKSAEAGGQPIDALFLPSNADEIAQLAPLIAYSGIDTKKVKLIGTSAWDVAPTLRDEVLIGAWYAASDPEAWSQFSQKFQKTFGQAPPRLATLAYDAASFAIDLAKVPAPARFADVNLRRPQGFAGVDGPFRFNTQGKAERSLAVLEIEKYRSVVIDPAANEQGAPVRSADASR